MNRKFYLRQREPGGDWLYWCGPVNQEWGAFERAEPFDHPLPALRFGRALGLPGKVDVVSRADHDERERAAAHRRRVSQQRVADVADRTDFAAAIAALTGTE